jgi:hypothetical protein
MSYPVLQWWWYTGTGGGGGGGGSGVASASDGGPALILPDPPERYSQEDLRQMQLALEQQDALVLKKTGDIYHPHSVTVRQRTIFPWVTLVADSVAPSVAQGRNFKTANTVPTTVTNFADGIDGQEIRVRVDDSSTVFDFTGSSLVGNGGSDYIAANGDQLLATYDADEGVWYCQVIGV